MSINVWKNGRDRSREAERRVAEAAREKRGRELDARLSASERAVARQQGKLEALRDRALADTGLREAVRVSLWAKVPGAVSGHYTDGEAVLTAPAGLPDGMTEEDLNAEVLRSLSEN